MNVVEQQTDTFTARLKRSRWNMAARTVGVLLLVLIAKLLILEPEIRVELEMRSQTDTQGELFVAGSDGQYVPERRSTFYLRNDQTWHTYSILVPWMDEVAKLRIDPGRSPGAIQLRRITLDIAGHRRSLLGKAIAEQVDAISNVDQDPNLSSNRYTSTGQDPWISVQLPVRMVGPTIDSVYRGAARSSLIIAGLWAVLELALLLAITKLAGRLRWIDSRILKLAELLSDEGVVTASRSTVLVLATFLATAVVYLALQLNQSAIGVWEEIYPERPVEQLVELGTAKHIRSDEWNTQTPWTFNQVLRGEPTANESVGGEEAPLVAFLPVRHPATWLVARYYGFRIFDLATGFSWMWAYRSIGTCLSFFWLLLILTRGNNAAALIGAAWVFGSSYTQWWLSSPLPEVMVIFAVSVIGALYLLFAQRPVMAMAGGALVLFGVGNALQELYPPSLVPLAYLGLALVAGRSLEPSALPLMRNMAQVRLWVSAATFASICGLVSWFAVSAWPTLKAMMSTVYPGQRVVGSGDMPVFEMMFGLFEAYRFHEGQFPRAFPNASEASNFLILAPLVFLVVKTRELAKRRSIAIALVVLYSGVLLAWICLPLPSVLERMLQLVGWSLSRGRRSILGMGIGSIILVVMLFAKVQRDDEGMRPRFVRMCIPVVVIAASALYGAELQTADPVFFTWKIVAAGTIVAALISGAVALGNTPAFAGGLALLVLGPMSVNPLVSGISSIQEKPILLAAKQLTQPGDRWAVFGDPCISQGLKAHGLTVLSGTTMVPNARFVSALDPGGVYAEVWNRYAHVQLATAPSSSAPSFALAAPDSYVVSLSVCGQHFRKLGVTRVAYTGGVPEQDLQCLTPLPAPGDAGVKLFRYR